MRTLLTFASILFFVLASCAQEDQATEEMVTPHQEFLTNLASLCGETFTGAAVYPEDSDQVLVGTELNAHVSVCEEENIYVDFYRDGDTWHATWILSLREEGLHLYHEHIGDKVYPEGEEPLTGYGGYADERGSATLQYFPADEATAEMLPEAATNVWMMEMDLENGNFIYSLDRHDQLRFRAELSLNER
jgi:hypothetical protein